MTFEPRFIKRTSVFSKPTRLACAALALSLFAMSSPQSAKSATPDQASTFRQQILNGTCLVPNISSGFSPVKLKNGKDAEGKIQIGQTAIGILNNKIAGVAEISDQSGGGSGIFVSLLLFEKHGNKVVTVGSYAVGDRFVVKQLKITNNAIHMSAQGTIGETEGQVKNETITKKDFDPSE